MKIGDFFLQFLMQVLSTAYKAHRSQTETMTVKSFPGRLNHAGMVGQAEVIVAAKADDRFSIDDVAAVVGLSPRHFKRRFKKATGENPLHYLQKIRMEKAKNMLETSLENIETITATVGYEDSRTFRRLFKKYTSLSPREYRDRFGTLQ